MSDVQILTPKADDTGTLDDDIIKQVEELDVTDDVTEDDVELADLMIDLLQLSQDLIHAKVKLESMTKNGWIEMAKARYVMGSNTVSATQLPQPDEESCVEAKTKLQSQLCQREGSKIKYTTFCVDKKSETDITEPQSSQEDGIRKRKGNDKQDISIENDVKEDKKCEDKCSEKKEKKEENIDVKKKNAGDPIRWFSVMPPSSLKMSQKWFTSGIEIVIEIANLQSEISSVTSRINKLKRLKSKKEKKDTNL